MSALSYKRRQEFISDRYETIFSELIQNREYIEDVVSKINEEPELACNISKVLDCHPDDFQMLSVRFFLELRDQVQQKIAEFAQDQAEWEADLAEEAALGVES